MTTFVIIPAAIAGLGEGELVGVALFAVGGVVALWWGIRAATDGYEIWSHEPVEAAAVPNESGVVEVTGTATPLEETVVAPYTETECLAHEYKTEVKEHDHDQDDAGTDWRTVDQGSGEVAFAVEDDSGTVAVDPSGAELSMADEQLSNNTHRRRIEERLDVGETVHVYGHRRDGGPDGSVYVGDGDEANFRIADTSAGKAVRRLLLKGVGAMAAGVVFLGVAGAIVVGA
jgi:hypothetical protein